MLGPDIWEKFEHLLDNSFIECKGNFFSYEFSVTCLIMSQESPCTWSLRIFICIVEISFIIWASYIDLLLEQWNSRLKNRAISVPSRAYNTTHVSPPRWVEEPSKARHPFTSLYRTNLLIRQFSNGGSHSSEEKWARKTKLDLKGQRTHSATEAIKQRVLTWWAETIDIWEEYNLWPDWGSDLTNNDEAFEWKI